jgi:hypothetical protein
MLLRLPVNGNGWLYHSLMSIISCLGDWCLFVRSVSRNCTFQNPASNTTNKCEICGQDKPKERPSPSPSPPLGGLVSAHDHANDVGEAGPELNRRRSMTRSISAASLAAATSLPSSSSKPVARGVSSNGSSSSRVLMMKQYPLPPPIIRDQPDWLRVVKTAYGSDDITPKMLQGYFNCHHFNCSLTTHL